MDEDEEIELTPEELRAHHEEQAALYEMLTQEFIKVIDGETIKKCDCDVALLAASITAVNVMMNIEEIASPVAARDLLVQFLMEPRTTSALQQALVLSAEIATKGEGNEH